MSVKVTASYIGDDKVEVLHGPSGAKITTDLPVDNGGQGRMFSPTDLAAASVASCILSIMAKMAVRDGIAFEGAAIEIEKHMTESPRRIAKLIGTVRLPAGLSEPQRAKLLAAVKACPVSRSLLPDIEIDLRAV